MSSTCEQHRPQLTRPTGAQLTVLLGSLVVGVVVPVLGAELLRHLVLGAGPTGINVVDLFFLTGAMGAVGPAAGVFAAAATRLPFVGVAVALLDVVALLVVESLRAFSFGGFLNMVGWIVVGSSLCLLGIDLVVLARRGRTFGIGWALGGAAAVAVLGVLYSLADVVAHGASFGQVYGDWRSLARLLAVTPAILLVAGAVGWGVQRVLSPASTRWGAAG
ncbi:MAG: hypothetical protein ACR2FG_12455 [Marmoricola sp.]